MRKLVIAIGSLLIMVTVSSHAAIPALSDVPNNIPEQKRLVLQKTRAGLAKRRDLIKAMVGSHNSKCRSVKKGSPQVAECRQSQRHLQSEIGSYTADIRDFNSAIAAAGASIPLHEDSDFPQLDRMLLGVQRIRVPPPIPARDVVLKFGQLAPADKTSKRVILGLESGVAVLDIFAKLGNVALPAKLILVAGKTFIAAEDAADVYLVQQTEVYERALKYLKQPETRLRFTAIVRAIKENKPLPEDENTDVLMLQAAQAILDPNLGNSGSRIAWNAMFSPEARRAALTQVTIELGGSILGGASKKVVQQVARVQNPAYLTATRTLGKAKNALAKTNNAKAKVTLQKIITLSNDKIAKTYQPEKAAEWSLDVFFKHEEEGLRELDAR